jgi:hypothetical protein
LTPSKLIYLKDSRHQEGEGEIKMETIDAEQKDENVMPESDKIKKAIKHIKTAWIAGITIGSLLIIFSIIFLLTEEKPIYGLYITIYSLLIIGISVTTFILSYGIYKKSRVCAIIMLISYVSKALESIIAGSVGNALIFIIISYFFFQGVRGTFAYHRLINEEKPPKEA